MKHIDDAVLYRIVARWQWQRCGPLMTAVVRACQKEILRRAVPWHGFDWRAALDMPGVEPWPEETT